MNSQQIPVLSGITGKVLLHCCCAPCSCAIIERLRGEGIDTTLYFYNPNIHPREEYEKRKAEIKGFAQRNGIGFVDADYETGQWFERIKGLENEPERGARCQRCFDMRLERAALYASENGFSVLATSLGISRRKNLDQVNLAGRIAVSRHANLSYLDFNWRKGGGADRGAEIARDEGFYRQNYCGCVFSLRNRDRDAPGKIQ